MFALKEKESFIVTNDNINFFNLPAQIIFNNNKDYKKIKKILEKVKIELTLKKENNEISIISAKAKTIINKKGETMTKYYYADDKKDRQLHMVETLLTTALCGVNVRYKWFGEKPFDECVCSKCKGAKNGK